MRRLSRQCSNKQDERQRNEVALREHLAYIDALQRDLCKTLPICDSLR